jgi:hypothetical protein
VIGLTVDQLKMIEDVVEDSHLAYIANTLGHDAVPSSALPRLKAKGLLKKTKMGGIEASYKLGRVASEIGVKAAKKLSVKDFKSYLKKSGVVLTPTEQAALTYATERAAAYITKLSGEVKEKVAKLTRAQRDKERRVQRDVVRKRVAENVVKRESYHQLARDLADSLGGTVSNFHRVAVTEQHNALQLGLAEHILDAWGKDARVLKVPAPDACPYCNLLFLDADGNPKPFTLKTIMYNTNVGRKAGKPTPEGIDWLPTVESVHPHCRCQLVRLPEGWAWDPKIETIRPLRRTS